MPVNVNYNRMKMFEDTFNASFREPFPSDLDPHCLNVNQMSYMGLSNTCYRYNLFCLQLQSSSSLSEEKHSNEAIAISSNIESIQKRIKDITLEGQNSYVTDSHVSHIYLPMLLDVSPRVLDWGNGYLHSRKLVFLTLKNRKMDRAVHIFKPSSSDRQFYASNFSGSLLDAGGVVSIGFIFQPERLGLSSAQLVIQTSIGGFVVHGKGFAVNNPSKDKCMDMLVLSFSGWWGKGISLFSSINMSVYPMDFESSLPGFMRSLFKKMLRGLTVKKIYAVTFFVVSLMFLRHCFMATPIMRQISKTCFFLDDNDAMPTFSSAGNSASTHQNQKVSELSISYEMDARHSSKKKSGSLVLDIVNHTELSVVSHCVKLEPVIHGGDNMPKENKNRGSVTSPVAESAGVLNVDNGDSASISTIAVKVGKEKRKKKKGKGKGSRAGVSVSIESSGSQSGYSTPSTPMSPVTTVLLPNRSACYAKSEKHNNFRSPVKTLTTHRSEKSAVIEKFPKASDLKLSVPKKVTVDTPKLAHNGLVWRSSASFPAADQPVRNPYAACFLPRSTVPPYARAPGPALCKNTCDQASESMGVVKEEAVSDFTYNIWGDYLFGSDRIGRPKEPSVISIGNGSDSFSFFAEGPAFLENFHPRYVSPFDPEGI